MKKNLIGIYEKGLSDDTDLYNILCLLKKTSFDYLEIAIDDTPKRLARLKMTKKERILINEFMKCNDLHIHSIVLSANRSYPLGSSIAEIQEQGLNIAKDTIELACDLHIPIVQIAGYFVFTGIRDGKERPRFINAMEKVVEHAARKGVMLGLENMDGKDILSIAEAKDILQEIPSPWFQLYPDIGNLVANQFNLEEEINQIADRAVAIHLKDTRVNEYRRVPFGEGEVDFALAADRLAKQGYRGCYCIEMWNDGHENSVEIVENAYRYIKNIMEL